LIVTSTPCLLLSLTRAVVSAYERWESVDAAAVRGRWVGRWRPSRSPRRRDRPSRRHRAAFLPVRRLRSLARHRRQQVRQTAVNVN